MADPISAPGTLETSILALRVAVTQERDVAAVAQKIEEKEPDFDGSGPRDSGLGSIVDVEA